MSTRRYPIIVRFDTLEIQELLHGVDEARVVDSLATRYARPESSAEDRAHIAAVQGPVYARLAYEIRTLARVTLVDEDDVEMVRTMFRLSTAWAVGPRWSAAEIASGHTSYHLLRDKLALRIGEPMPDNEHLLALAQP